jgi:4-amino-4-deoxy-L-arabinose transferase-like glycosyltransferase
MVYGGAAMPRSFRSRLLVLVAFALAIRLLNAFTLATDLEVRGDALNFHLLANLLADGEGWIRPYEFVLNGVRDPTAEHPPLYILYLTGWSALGLDTIAWHRVASCLLGAAAVGVTGLLGRRVGGDRAGLAAAGLAAVYPLLWVIDGSIMTESMYALTVALVLLAAVAAAQDPTPRRFALAGAAMGLAALTRSEAVLLPAILGVPLVLVAVRTGWRPRFARLAATGVAFVLVLSPWLVRLAVEFDRFVPVTTTGGPLLSGTNCDPTYRGDGLGSWRLACTQQREEELGAKLEGLNEAERHDLLREPSLDYVRDNLGRLPVVLAARLGRAWDLYRPRQAAVYEQLEGRHLRVSQIGIAVYFLLLPLAAAGAWGLRHRRRELVVLLTPFLLVTITSLIGYGLTRLRLAAEIPLVVLAALALTRLRLPTR